MVTLNTVGTTTVVGIFRLPERVVVVIVVEPVVNERETESVLDGVGVADCARTVVRTVKRRKRYGQRTDGHGRERGTGMGGDLLEGGGRKEEGEGRGPGRMKGGSVIEEGERVD